MAHFQTEWLPPRMEFYVLRSRSLGCRFSRALGNMAARTPGERDYHGGGDPQQILRSCAESLFTAVARLQEGERHSFCNFPSPIIQLN